MIWLVLLLGAIGSGWLLGRGDLEANLLAAREAAGADLAGLLLGLTLGRMGRDRVRLRRTYASPTLAHVAKSVFFLSLGLSATFVLSPVAWNLSWHHAGVAGAAAGLCLWLGNLPFRM